MFMAMLERHCQHVIDTDALAILPRPSAREPLQPSADDEAAHPPGGDPLWSESWYFDFADVAALPEEHTHVRTGDVDLVLEATEPLRSYRVTLHGRGQAYDDPAALLRGEPGRPVEVTMDLTWTTVGMPYRYRLSPRYEIPCAVSGTVTADGRSFAFSDAAGQRDHSWAPRDCWSMDWVWSALHLDDGTHVHGLDLRIPGMPRMSVGYLQRAGEPLVELESVAAREDFGDDLPIGTTLELSPGNLTATIDVRGHAPVLLTSPDGRISQFPRAWATVATTDGRAGVGWLEWNRNQS